MPGIFGVASASASEERLTALGERMRSLHGTCRQTARFVDGLLVSPPFLVGHHSIRSFESHKGLAQSGPLAMVLDGVLFEPDSKPDVTELLSRYSCHGSELVQGLRGHFALAVCSVETGELSLYTDHAATRPVYYAVHDGEFYFSGDCLALSAIYPGPKKLNHRAVADMLSFGFMTGDKTPDESIRCMPAGSCLTWNTRTDTFEIKPYFVTTNTPRDCNSYEELRSELQSRFVQAVERTLRGTKPLFTLSGGLDSRAVLSTALQHGLARPDSLTFGELSSKDVELALEVARSAGAQAVLVSLGDGDYLVDTFEAASYYNGGMVYYSGSAHMLHALQRLNPGRWDVVQTGMSGDMLMGSFLRAGEVGEPVGDTESVVGRIIEQLGRLAWIEHLTVDRMAARELVWDSVRDSVVDIEPNMTMSQVLELWNLRNRQQRSMFNGFRVIENFADYTSPFFDADLYAFALSIPHGYRLGEAIYVDMLSHLLEPGIWRVPWQKTGRRPSTRRWVNRVNAWNSLWLGRGLQLVRPSTGRRRSMNPFGIWLRENARLRSFCADLLLAWDAVPYPLDRAKVQQFARGIAEADVGVDLEIPTVLFRLLTLFTWENRYGSR